MTKYTVNYLNANGKTIATNWTYIKSEVKNLYHNARKIARKHTTVMPVVGVQIGTKVWMF